MYVYYNNFQLIHEPSNIYPAGYHHSKAKREIPPLIDIAAGDSQIFDICSSTNHNIDFRFIRFEDHFSFSRKEGKYHSLVHRPIYIRLFVYSDNNSPVENLQHKRHIEYEKKANKINVKVNESLKHIDQIIN